MGSFFVHRKSAVVVVAAAAAAVAVVDVGVVVVVASKVLGRRNIQKIVRLHCSESAS